MKRKLSGIIHIQSKNPPIVELDSEAHAAYVRFSSNRVARTELITDNGCIVTVDRDRRGNAIGVEFVGVDTFNIESLLRKARVRISKSLSQRASYIPAEHDLVAAQQLAIIEVRPYRGGWQVYEAPGVQPFFTERDAKRMAIDYATSRMKGRRGQIRIWRADGTIEEVREFDPDRQT